MKKVYMGLICSLLFAGMVSANTNIAVWVGGDTPTTFISGSGYMVAPYFAGNGSLLTDVVGVGSTLPTAYIWVGGATSNAASKAVSGDITITTNGAVTIGARKVLGSMLPQATDGQLLIGRSVGGSNVVAETISGDITLATNGVVAVTKTTGNLTVGAVTTNTGAVKMLSTLVVDGAVTLSAPAGLGTYTNAAVAFTNVFDVGGRLVSHDP